MTDKARLTINAALASVAAALFLLVLKGAAAWETGSVAMLGSLADTALDLLASIVTLTAFGSRPRLPITTTASAMAKRKRWRPCSRWR
jgi:divalent metal cation (Fe/Co/Zn/Cd) transporter